MIFLGQLIVAKKIEKGIPSVHSSVTYAGGELHGFSGIACQNRS